MNEPLEGATDTARRIGRRRHRPGSFHIYALQLIENASYFKTDVLYLPLLQKITKGGPQNE